jgi:fido (protein-threonine AMPylation protein)
MAIVPLPGRPFDVELRDIPTSILSALALCFKAGKVAVSVNSLLSRVPLGAYPDARTVARLGRRLGLALEPLAADGLAAQLVRGPAIVVRRSGYSFAVLARRPDGYVIGLPGNRAWLNMAQADDIVEPDSALYGFNVRCPSRALAPRNRNPRLWLLQWEARYAAHHDGAAIDALQARHAGRGAALHPPQLFMTLDTPALLAAHAAMNPACPELFGRFRDVNLRRDSLFVDHRCVPELSGRLLDIAAAHQPLDEAQAAAFAARLFCDFLSIHPFANGNRRMGMTLAALYLGRWGYHMRWDAVGIAPLYYAVRCASNGHIGPLMRLFAQHVQSDALRFGPLDHASGQISFNSAARL